MSRAFIVFSSSRHVSYMNEVLGIIKSVLESLDMGIIYLGDGFRGIRYYPEMLRQNISESDFGIVILDGLRPNITYELGLLQMSKIDVIPLIKDDAKFSVKSIYYNLHKRLYDSELAFGEYRFRKSAFKNLIEPNIVIPEHFSDCQGMHEIRYNAIDDTQENGSLGKVLRDEITKIIPHLRSRTGPGFTEIHMMFPDIELTILDESVQLLSLFSVLGWNQNYIGDTTFQSIREEFLSLFINQQVSLEQVNTIFNLLLESPENIIKNYGRYLTIDSERLIHQSFDYLMRNNEIFNRYYIQIMQSTQTELKRRFIERIKSSDVLDNETIEAIGNYIFDRSNLFTDISTIQDKDSCQFFVSSASINPSKALDLMLNWISPLTPIQMAELFPFQSTVSSPRNPHDDVLWFLNEISKNNAFFTQSMEILFKFSLPIIVNEEQIRTHIHSAVHKLALDRFLEQCHSLTGEVNVRTRWNFIQNLLWSEDWSDDYIKSTKILKFRAIQTFLQRSWTIPEPIREGTIRISHFRVPNGLNYDELENCRSEAYQIIMEWLDQTDTYADIYDSLFEYFYRNLSEYLKYIPWDKIKLLFIRIFNNDSLRILEFLAQIDKLRAYNNLQKSYSEEHLRQIFQFQEELEEGLTAPDSFRRKMRFSIYTPEVIGMFSEQTEREDFINSLQTENINQYLELDETESKELTNILLLEESNQSYEFGLKLKDHLTGEKIKSKIEYCTEIIERDGIENVLEFYVGLWSALFYVNKEEWENLLDNNWNNSIIQPYLEKIIWRTDQYFNEFRWNKYIELFESRMIGPIELIAVIHRKESISIDEKRLILLDCLRYFEELITSEVQYPTDIYIRFIWRVERLISENEDLINNVLAESFFDIFQPISRDILSQLHNTDIIIRIGQLSEQFFNNWLKIGFQVSERDDNFLLKCTDFFMDRIFQIAEHLFAVYIEGEEMTEDHYISYAFKVSGDPRILLKFTDEQIDRLYELNSSMLGSLFGRLIQYSPIEDNFPTVLKRLIINHNDDLDFKNGIFQSFSTGVRSFVGNNYDQQYAGDYARITQWRESATNSIFRGCLRELHQYIDSLRNENREFWREREVE